MDGIIDKNNNPFIKDSWIEQGFERQLFSTGPCALSSKLQNKFFCKDATRDLFARSI
jgi:hypothetical protein